MLETKQKLQIKIGTKLFDRFQNIPVSLKIRFYFLNITNKDEVLAGFERPKFEEVGPFVYEERRRRYVMDFEDMNRKLRYRESKFYYSSYEKHMALMKQNNNTDLIANDINYNATAPFPEPMLNPNTNNITIINVPLLSILTKLAGLPEGTLKRTLASKIAQNLVKDGNDKILITKPANELLFDGYRVDVLESVRKLMDNLGFNFDSPLVGNKFGFYYTKNGTWSKSEGGEFVIWTGRGGSMNEFPQVASWNDQSILQVWPNDTLAGNNCNRIRGTDGSSFHPGLSRHQTLHVFSPLICTSIYFKYQYDTQVNGIPVWRYGTPPDVFAAPGKNERKQCYCTIKQPGSSASSLAAPKIHLQDEDSMPINNNNNNNNLNNGLSTTTTTVTSNTKASINNSRCFIDGILDLSLCQKGAPIAASGAHFYNADPMLALSTGLKPDKAKHETVIDIEPMTGNVMRASSRAQLNAFVEEAALQIVDSNITGHMTPMIAPLLWLEETGGIDEKLATEFKSKLLNMVQKVRRTCIICIITGLVLIALVSFHYWYTTCHQIDLKGKRDRIERKSRRSTKTRHQTSGIIKKRLTSIDDDFTNKLNLQLDKNFVGADVVGGSMGAIGAELPISANDKHKLIDDDDDDDQDEIENINDFQETQLDQEQQPTTSRGRVANERSKDLDSEVKKPLFNEKTNR